MATGRATAVIRARIAQVKAEREAAGGSTKAAASYGEIGLEARGQALWPRFAR